MQPGYYWARWKDKDGTLDDEWEIIEVVSESFVCRIGDDRIWNTSHFEFGGRIER